MYEWHKKSKEELMQQGQEVLASLQKLHEDIRLQERTLDKIAGALEVIEAFLATEEETPTE